MTADDYARMLYSLLPPGKIWRVVGSKLYSFLLGCADEFVRVHDRVEDVFNEADPTTAVELLPEFEEELDLDAAPTTAERQANITARLVQLQGFRPTDFQAALAPLFAQDAAAVAVIERSLAYVAAVGGDQRVIFEFFVYRDPGVPGTYFLATAQQLIDDMEPSHTQGAAIESISMLCDDAHSLTDRDLLGA